MTVSLLYADFNRKMVVLEFFNYIIRSIVVELVILFSLDMRDAVFMAHLDERWLLLPW
jgi:hypothetical protein